MDDSTSDSELVENWRSGDEDAATALYERYLQKLLRLVGHHLASRFNPRLDPEDVVQSVFKSLFRRARDGDFEFQDDEDFWKLLLTIALNKVRNKVRFHSAAKRDPSRETSPGREQGADSFIRDQLSRGSTAAESVAFADLLEAVLNSLGEPQQQLIQYRLEGCTQTEIAENLRVDPKTLRRMYGQIRDRVVELYAEEFPEATDKPPT